eukprot:6174478-Pleurochrysis_carterae.AAC.1
MHAFCNGVLRGFAGPPSLIHELASACVDSPTISTRWRRSLLHRALCIRVFVIAFSIARSRTHSCVTSYKNQHEECQPSVVGTLECTFVRATIIRGEKFLTSVWLLQMVFLC